MTEKQKYFHFMAVLSHSFYVLSLLSTLFCVTVLAVVLLWVRQASQETTVQVCPKEEEIVLFCLALFLKK